MTTGGEGGMVVTDDPEWWNRAWSFKDHGKSFDTVHHRKHGPGFRWVHEGFGTNWRLTDLQSALGRRMLPKLPEWIRKRRENAAILTSHFSDIQGLRVTNPLAEIGHSYYKYYAFVRPEGLKEGWDRDRILTAINAEGIPCFAGSCSEIYLEKAFPRELRPTQRLPVAQELGETSLMFLVHPTLSENDMLDTCAAVAKVMGEAATPSSQPSHS